MFVVYLCHRECSEALNDVVAAYAVVGGGRHRSVDDGDRSFCMQRGQTNMWDEGRERCDVGRERWLGGRDGRGEDILLMLFYQTLEAVAVCRGVEITGR